MTRAERLRTENGPAYQLLLSCGWTLENDGGWTHPSEKDSWSMLGAMCLTTMRPEPIWSASEQPSLSTHGGEALGCYAAELLALRRRVAELAVKGERAEASMANAFFVVERLHGDRWRIVSQHRTHKDCETAHAQRSMRCGQRTRTFYGSFDSLIQILGPREQQ